MGTRELPLPMCFELLLGKERERCPLEARLICAAHHGSVRKIKTIQAFLECGNQSKFSPFHLVQALKMDSFDAKLLSNRSLCLLRMGDGRGSYEDATECTKLRPKWAKAHYREGAALMFMKEYDAAYSSLSLALELDPESEEIEKLFWEAMELK